MTTVPAGGTPPLPELQDLRAPTAGTVPAPEVVFLGGVVDDYVVRLVLPGGLVHDCTPSQAIELGTQLQETSRRAQAVQQGRQGRGRR